MKKVISLVSAAFVGIIFGMISNYSSVFFGSWFNIIIWGLVGVLIGLFVENKKSVPCVGIFYGFFLTLSFLFSGFRGTTDKLPGFIFLSAILSVIGAGAGWFVVGIGNWMKRHTM